MILQLAQFIQSFLHQHNVPNLSFFEQMLANQQKQEELMFQEKQIKEKAKVAKDREREQDVVSTFVLTFTLLNLNITYVIKINSKI